MRQKITITPKQVEQFNRMRAALIKISRHYMTPEQIRKDDKDGLDYEEYLEMSYENIQGEAAHAVKHVKIIPLHVEAAATS